MQNKSKPSAKKLFELRKLFTYLQQKIKHIREYTTLAQWVAKSAGLLFMHVAKSYYFT